MELTKTTYKQTEIGLIPSDWELKTIGDVGEVKMCKRIFNYQTSERGDIPFYKIGTFGKSADAYISKELYQDFKRKYSFPKKGAVLISAAGTIGRTIIYDGEDGYFQDSNIVWIDNNFEVISDEYLYYTFPIVKFRTEGGTIQRLYNNILKSGIFPAPPTLTEQKAIATALSDVDALISSLDKLISKKKAIKQGAMQELLTPPQKGGKRLAGFSGDWEEATIGELFTVKAGGDLEKESYSPIQNNIFPFCIYANALTHRGIYGYTNNPKYNAGCITITARGSLGHAEYRDAPFDAIVRLLVLEPRVKIDGVFFTEYINNKIVFAYESTGVPQLTGPQVSKYIIEYPKDLEEQKTIAQILADMDTEIESLERKKAKYQSIKQGMMQELLTGKTRLI